MRFIKLLSVLTLMLVAVSCSNQVDEPASSEITRIDLSSQSFTLADAQTRLELILSNPALGFATTRSTGSERFHVSNGRALDRHGNLLTRENEEEAMVYVFDTDDCGGYAIMGATPELPELISVCQGGVSDTDSSPDSMKSFISSLRDSLIATPILPINPIETVWVRGQTRYTNVALLPAISNEWGTRYPFSYAWTVTSTSPENPMPRHNSVAAVSLLLLSKKYGYLNDSLRNEFLQYTLYDTICKYDSQTQMKISMYMKGVSFKFGIEHWPDYIPYTISDVSQKLQYGFNQLGYSNIGTLQPYSLEPILSEIEHWYPVLMLGKRHTWLVSAVVVQERPMYEVEKSTGRILFETVEKTYLLHCNWGWNGHFNGFYDSHLFSQTESDFEHHEDVPSYIYTTIDTVAIQNNIEGLQIYSGMRP